MEPFRPGLDTEPGSAGSTDSDCNQFGKHKHGIQLFWQLLVELPRRISPQIQVTQDSLVRIPQLAVWLISGRDTEVRSFRRKLTNSYSTHGGKNPISLTTHRLGSGIAGVLDGIRIPFQVL